MTKYKLIKCGNKKFPSGDTIKYYPIKSVELTEEELRQLVNIHLIPSRASGKPTHKILFEITKEKLRKVLE